MASAVYVLIQIFRVMVQQRDVLMGLGIKPLLSQYEKYKMVTYCGALILEALVVAIMMVEGPGNSVGSGVSRIVFGVDSCLNRQESTPNSGTPYFHIFVGGDAIHVEIEI